MEAKHHPNEEQQQQVKEKAVVFVEEEEENQQEDDKHTVSSAGSSPLPTIPSSPPSSSTHPPSNSPLKALEPQPHEDSDSPPHPVNFPSNSCLTSDHSSISRVSSHPRSPPPAVDVRYGPINAVATTPVAVAMESSRTGDEFVERNRVERGGGGGRRLRPDLSILKRAKKESMVKRALLVFRVCGFVCCLVAFSVMVADQNQGWALDSFYRYKELRFCLAVNAIGFIYSGLQAFDVAYYSATGKHIVRHHLRPQVDFVLDQIISYLLISAISSSATRVEDWQTNWGKDKFPEMAIASVAITIIAFVSFALSSVVSGYTLCTLRSI